MVAVAAPPPGQCFVAGRAGKGVSALGQDEPRCPCGSACLATRHHVAARGAKRPGRSLCQDDGRKTCCTCRLLWNRADGAGQFLKLRARQPPGWCPALSRGVWVLSFIWGAPVGALPCLQKFFLSLFLRNNVYSSSIT